MKNKYTQCVLGVMMIVFFISIQAQEPNWPQFRGINCSGLAGADQHPPFDLDMTKHLIWKTSLNTGQSSPCIWGEMIFLTGFDDISHSLNIFAINRDNGAVRWEKDLKVDTTEQVHRVSSQANATPATDGNIIVFYFGSYGVLCFDFDGNLLWERKMPVPETVHGMGTSPVITGELVLLNLLGQINDPCLLALDKSKGTVVWKYTSESAEGEWVDSYSTPVIYRDRVIIYRSRDIGAYSIKTGQQLWNFPTGTGDAVCTPVMANGLLYFTVFTTMGNTSMLDQYIDFNILCADYDVNGDRQINKEEGMNITFLNYPEKSDIADTIPLSAMFGMFDQNQDQQMDSLEYEGMWVYCRSFYDRQGIKAIRLGGKGEIGMDHFVWGNPDQVPHVTSPLYLDGRVYEIKSGGILSCFRSDDGTLLYRERIGAGGTYFASPVAAGKLIYLAARNGVITVIEAGDAMKVVSRSDLDETIAATPAIVDNKIYIRTDHSLYAFGQ
ncbi:MAG: outer membrane protein assembly factor BamB family protein [Bacteroidales bacterium]